MSDQLSCLACGFEGYDVRMTIVEIPEAERRQVNVALTHERRKGQLPEVEYREVAEVYAREPRCRDRAGCKERVAAIELAILVAAPVVEPEPEPTQPAWVI